MSEPRPPVIGARRIMGEDGIARLVFWCPFCRQEHTHGGGDSPGDGDGFRHAHCGAGSPFRETGYVLQEIREDAPNVATIL